MEFGLNRSATRFELSRQVEIARTCLRHVGKQVCDYVCDHVCDLDMEFAKFHYANQLANWSATSSRAE